MLHKKLISPFTENFMMETESQSHDNDDYFYQLDEAPIGDENLNHIKLSFFKKIYLKIFGYVFMHNIQLKNWSNSLPMYAFNCPKHGLQVSYPVGWRNVLVCNKCVNEK